MMKNILNKSYQKINIVKYDLEDLLENNLDEIIKNEIEDLIPALQKDSERLKLLEWFLNGDIKQDLYEAELKKIKDV